ncbi:hypothetical protein BH09ACT13_BH09ACT13_12650 [soil metagenome]
MNRRGAGRAARLQSAIPLLVLYFGLAALYAWQASRRPVPTIFTDELELTQLSRAIADTGEPARRGVAYESVATLVAYFLAPVWWLGTVSASYATAKLLLVLAMTATIFPAYALARFVVSPWYALAAACGATAVPALAYSPILVEEPLAYPLSTLALLTIARVLAAPSRGRVGLAVLASAAAALTRTQLAVLFAVLVLGLLWLAWSSEPGRRWRSGWTRWDWIGAVALAVGVALAFSAFMGHASTSWRNTTGFYKDRILDHSLEAMGALAIGVGVLPVLVGIAALARPRYERSDPRTRAFVVTSVAALVAFVWYAGIKGAYISTVFATVVVERNVIYLYPILFAATALAIERGVGRNWAIAGATVFTLWIVAGTPLHLGQYPYYEAHGLAIAAFANRELGWPEGRIEGALIVVCLLCLAFVVALRMLRRDSGAYRGVAATAAVLVLAWSLTAEVYAAEGERDLSTRVATNLPKPYDWVERATGGASVVVIGQQILDATNVWLTEFFNPSVKKMWSLDGTAINVGAPILTPDLQASDGTLTPSPETEYALALNGVELLAPVVDRRGRDTLYQVGGEQLRLRSAIIGVQSDGWMTGSSENRVATASYTRYDVSQDGPGFAVVKLSRRGFCVPGRDVPSRATVRIGPVTIGPDKKPALGRVTSTQTKILHPCTDEGFTLAPPTAPWRVEITIEPTFSPQEIVPSHSDSRQLGATVQAGFQPLFG